MDIFESSKIPLVILWIILILVELGIFGVSINYFIYKRILEKGKNKYGSDIIRLAKEIAEE